MFLLEPLKFFERNCIGNLRGWRSSENRTNFGFSATILDHGGLVHKVASFCTSFFYLMKFIQKLAVSLPELFLNQPSRNRSSWGSIRRRSRMRRPNLSYCYDCPNGDGEQPLGLGHPLCRRYSPRLSCAFSAWTLGVVAGVRWCAKVSPFWSPDYWALPSNGKLICELEGGKQGNTDLKAGDDSSNCIWPLPRWHST